MARRHRELSKRLPDLSELDELRMPSWPNVNLDLGFVPSVLSLVHPVPLTLFVDVVAALRVTGGHDVIWLTLFSSVLGSVATRNSCELHVPPTRGATGQPREIM